ncbi:MAG: hypothetical protein AUI91_11405 [Acidobacteria bacterium 13_1_40CM_3_56_11]|nr:MAG: hypothetical protein AUH28_02175 [Acidobacteria bacterium 13_1_40CM_56_16]OLD18044.1 MAG: hypothetical protein AUI91_11405 [Acidobacteria bacterium 13_1_40CM_3_56_11]
MGTTTRVLGVIAASIFTGSILNVSGSISTNFGRNPSTRAISGTTQNVNAGKMISESRGRLRDFKM